MRALIIALFLVALSLLGLLGAGSLMDEEWRIERSIHIAAEPIDVFATVCNLKTWPQWNTWHARVQNEIQYEYSQRAWGRDAEQRWRHGELWGRRAVTDFMPGQSMQYVQVNGTESGRQTRMRGALDVAPEGSGSRLRWRLEGQVAGNPLDKLFMRLYRRRIEAVMEDSLSKLAQRYNQAAGPGA